MAEGEEAGWLPQGSLDPKSSAHEIYRSLTVEITLFPHTKEVSVRIYLQEGSRQEGLGECA